MRSTTKTILCLLAVPLWAAAAADRVDWLEFLARHDLVWPQRLPAAWREGAFLGNGLLGLMIYTQDGNALRLDVGRSDVIDHRDDAHSPPAGTAPLSAKDAGALWKYGGGNPLINKARLPIGNFLIMPVGKLTGGKMRLDLWNAEATGTLTTDKGTIAWRSFVHASDKVMVVEIDASEGEKDFAWRWVPALSESSRVYGKGRPPDYKANPAPKLEEMKDAGVCIQPLLDGGEYATAWRQFGAGTGKRTIYVSVGYSWPGATAAREAQDEIARAASAGMDALTASHRQWWHAFYPESFVSIPDTRMESFYWIQMYKLASATRADRPAMDLMGPWYKKTLWPGIWWNLNIQLAYYPVYTANRLELGESLARMLENNASNLAANVKFAKWCDFDDDSAWVARVTSYDCAGGMFKGQQGAPEVGNLPWACQNYWRQCRYAADDARLREKMLPLLRRAINFYLHMLNKGADGKYHLPATYSPEYGFSKDLNYDLSLLRWGCQTLAAECERLRIDDPLLPKWKDVLANLVAFPVDENGFRLGADQPFSRSHRHYSHLLMIYPLYVVNWDQPENRALIEKSVAHWTGMKGAFNGYSYTGASSMYSSMSRGNEAYEFLVEFMGKVLEPNTMYLEADSPCIESPLSGAQSVQDMLLQSWGSLKTEDGRQRTDDGGQDGTRNSEPGTRNAQPGGYVSTIRVFPGVPDTWKDTVFRDLRAEGAFLVSAVRKGGKTQWVRVKSLAGWPCRIKPALEGEVRATVPLKPLGDGAYALELNKGGEAVLYSGAQVPACEVTAVAADPAQCNFFGERAVKPAKPAKGKKTK